MRKFRTMVTLGVSIGVMGMLMYNVNALNKDDAYDEILHIYKDDSAYLNGLKSHLVNSNILTEGEYNRLKVLRKKYVGSDIEWWWLADTGRLFFDEIVFNDIHIKDTWDKLISQNNSSSQYIYNKLKKEFISNIENMDLIYNENLKKVNLIEIFEKYFGRTPTKQEVEWLKEKDKIRYSLYGGIAGGEITSYEINLIDNNKGYLVLGISATEKNEYLEYVNLSERIREKEVEYIRSVEKLKDIKVLILNTYKINIEKELTIEEREEIYLKSVKDYIYDLQNAFELTIKKLKEKGLIEGDINPPSIEPDKPGNEIAPPVDDDFTEDNFFDDLLENKNNNKNNEIHKFLNGSVASFYKPLDSLRTTGEFIYFKYKDLEYNTNSRVDSIGNMTKDSARNLMEFILRTTQGKQVKAKNKTMVLIDKKVGVGINYSKDKKEVSMIDAKNFFNKLDINIYTKYLKNGKEI